MPYQISQQNEISKPGEVISMKNNYVSLDPLIVACTAEPIAHQVCMHTSRNHLVWSVWQG